MSCTGSILPHATNPPYIQIYEKREGLGGTWRVNTYPGWFVCLALRKLLKMLTLFCAAAPMSPYIFILSASILIPIGLKHLQTKRRFSDVRKTPTVYPSLVNGKGVANTNIDMEDTVDKFQLRSHFRFNTECTGAEWVDGAWHVHFVNPITRQKFTKQCTILLSAVGGFSIPRPARFRGMDKYKGRVFHTAEWDHTFDWTNKSVAVIGNGCSAAQVVPSIAPGVKRLVQYARSPQWYHPRPNRGFSAFDRFCFRYLPFWQRYYRLDLFLKTDSLASVYGSDERQIKKRLAVEEEARSYIRKEAPLKYHDFIFPDFPLGCKRRIYDPGYLASLHCDNVELLPEGIQEFNENGLVSETGKREDFDAVILATGFDVQSFLAPMKITGKTGEELQEQWSKRRGAQAYMGTFVHNMPNLAIL